MLMAPSNPITRVQPLTLMSTGAVEVGAEHHRKG